VRKVRSGLIAVLDVGSFKISCFIAQIMPDNTLRIIGIGHQHSLGIKNGNITDIKQAESSIIAAVTSAEKMADEVIDKVVVTASGGNPVSIRVLSSVEISGDSVSPRDIKRAILRAKEQFDDPTRRIVHAVPVSFVIDDIRGIDDPIGMTGKELIADIHLITISESTFKNLTNCISNCELDIQDFVISSHASGLTCLTEDEKELGVTLIELGGGVTGMSSFVNGKNIFTDSVSYGGINVTTDIARGLATTKEIAERVKNLYGSAMPSASDRDTTIDVPQFSEETGRYSEEMLIPRSELVGVISPRIEEIFEMVKKKIAGSSSGHAISQHYVLSGGASQLLGIREMATKILGGNVRLGRPELIEGMADSTANAAFSSCAGLINYISMNYHVYDKVVPVERYIQQARAEGSGFVGSVFGWLKANF
jgi:cell division protein FtsA